MITPHRVRHDLRCAGSVKRYHTWPTISQQTVADHTFHVLRIFRECYPGHLATMRVVDEILYHDMAEITTGDLPYPVKRENRELGRQVKMVEDEWFMEMGIEHNRLNEDERHCLKMCDMLEMAEFAVHEMCLGNTYALPVYSRIMDWYLESGRQVRNDQTDEFVNNLCRKVGEMNDERPVLISRKSA